MRARGGVVSRDAIPTRQEPGCENTDFTPEKFERYRRVRCLLWPFADQPDRESRFGQTQGIVTPFEQQTSICPREEIEDCLQFASCLLRMTNSRLKEGGRIDIVNVHNMS